MAGVVLCGGRAPALSSKTAARLLSWEGGCSQGTVGLAGEMSACCGRDGAGREWTWPTVMVLMAEAL